MQDFGDPLLLHIVERVGRVDGEADQDDVRVGVRQGAETVIVLLTGGIPERELNPLTVDDDVGNAARTDESLRQSSWS